MAKTPYIAPGFDVWSFHDKFELPRPMQPTMLSAELVEFRANFLQEELDEFREAAANSDLEKMLDALVDLTYVAVGTAVMMGVDFAEAWRRVHAANMAKVRAQRAEDSKRGSTFDVVKPPGWTPPDLSDLVA